MERRRYRRRPSRPIQRIVGLSMMGCGNLIMEVAKTGCVGEDAGGLGAAMLILFGIWLIVARYDVLY